VVKWCCAIFYEFALIFLPNTQFDQGVYCFKIFKISLQLNNQGRGILKFWVGNKRIGESLQRNKKILRVYSENRKKRTKKFTISALW
jgi:hypothetical protein